MSAAASLEQHLAAAVQDGKIPHAVVFATNRDGMLTNYTGTQINQWYLSLQDASRLTLFRYQ
jgi:hypothetical protein